tara:strand:+ start:436 stop:750 length:315 start_codon:yes stop_codon:yes gene_type:complete
MESDRKPTGLGGDTIASSVENAPSVDVLLDGLKEGIERRAENGALASEMEFIVGALSVVHLIIEDVEVCDLFKAITSDSEFAEDVRSRLGTMAFLASVGRSNLD